MGLPTGEDLSEMAAPTLQQVFGANAVQTETTVTITKADLASTGFTPSATNTADSLLAAIIAFAQTSLPDSTVSTNVGQSVGISDGFQSITLVNNQNYLVNPKTVNFYQVFTAGTFNPNNY